MTDYMFIQQLSYELSDRQLDDRLVTGASQLWMEFEVFTVVNRYWRDGRLVEQWSAVTDRIVIFSSGVH
jgi:hypothetical protein